MKMTFFNLESFGCDKGRQVRHTAGITPFVVVPGYHFDKVVAQNLSGQTVDDGRATITAEVRRDKRLISETQDAIERPGCSFYESCIDSVFAGFFAHGSDKVHDRDGQVRHTQGHTIEAPLEFWDDQGNGFGRAG